MRIADVMTRDVASISPDATLQEAAERMRALDVGAIPVVRDGRPVGVITDRDLTIRGIADGRTPTDTSVGQLMSDDVVYVRASDYVEDAAEVMQARQVRRLLVIDDDERLCGIVSLGDLALRGESDDLSEETLEDVSWPGHPQGGGRMFSSTGRPNRTAYQTWKHAEAGAGWFAALAGGIALGAGLMYMLDPVVGRRRRALLRDQAYSATHRTQDRLRKSAEYTRDRARGVYAETRGRFRHDEASDDVVRDRVRAAIGRAVSHAGALSVDVSEGVVTLRGPVLATEVDNLLKVAASVRGVEEVNDQLDVHESPSNIPGLQD